MTTDDLPEMEHDVAAPSPLLPIAGALAGGVAGAVAWAALIYFAQYEIGYLAWGIGALVGFVAVRCGGRGAGLGVAAAVITLASIFAGKLAGVYMLDGSSMAELEQELLVGELSPVMFAEYQTDAADLAALPADVSDEDLALFMVEHEYTGVEDPTEIDDPALAEFREFNLPNLLELHAEQPDYETWREEQLEKVRTMVDEDYSRLDAVIENLEAIDIIFAVLGIVTAFGFLSRAAAA